jgi:hypothetical protein
VAVAAVLMQMEAVQAVQVAEVQAALVVEQVQMEQQTLAVAVAVAVVTVLHLEKMVAQADQVLLLCVIQTLFH